jgi:hypothetical protein
VRLAAVAVFLASGCSDRSIDTIFDPCSELTVVAAEGTEPHELASIEEAVLVWDQVLPTEIAVGSSADAAGTLAIHFDSGDTFYRAIYFDALATIRVSRDKLAPEDYPIAIAHELGHAFGLFHVDSDERESVMNAGNLEILATRADADEVRALWAACAD